MGSSQGCTTRQYTKLLFPRAQRWHNHSFEHFTETGQNDKGKEQMVWTANWWKLEMFQHNGKPCLSYDFSKGTFYHSYLHCSSQCPTSSDDIKTTIHSQNKRNGPWCLKSKAKPNTFLLHHRKRFLFINLCNSFNDSARGTLQ